jgi:Flp pilus assembly protein TadG
MHSRSAQGLRSAAARRLRGFVRDVRGVSAIEFALILPAMVLLYFGLAEITMSMMAQRRASHAASAVGDLVAQNKNQNITRDLVDDIFYVGVGTMRPFPTADLSLRVTSVRADEDNIPRVIWSRAHGPGMTKLAAGEDVTVPGNLLVAGDSVVMSEMTYSYETPFKYFVPNSLVFQDKFYLRPRRTAVIQCPDCP